MDHVLSHLPECFLLAFLAITFLQSGLDKWLDWKGNLEWLQSHFSKTFMSGMVPFLQGTLMLVETATGLLAVWGIVALAVQGSMIPAKWAALLACLSLLMLLFGQRIAKDYDGARTIVIYFVPAIFLLFLLF